MPDDIDIMTEKAEIRGQLLSFRDQRGRLNGERLLEELYVETVLGQRQITKIQERCPVSAGRLSWKDAHGSQFLRWVKNNPWRFFGLILLFVAIIVPASVAAEILHLGGI